jgi:hypothetical protein
MLIVLVWIKLEKRIEINWFPFDLISSEISTVSLLISNYIYVMTKFNVIVVIAIYMTDMR